MELHLRLRASLAIWDHSVTCHWKQMEHTCCNPNQTVWYSINLASGGMDS